MTAGPGIDPDVFLHEQLAPASPDLMREMLATFINSLLSAPTAATGTANATCCENKVTRDDVQVLRSWAIPQQRSVAAAEMAQDGPDQQG